MFSRIPTPSSIGRYSEQIVLLRQKLNDADAVIIGAGAGLSTSAGLTYDGPRFEYHFADFIAKYHIADMYSGGFYPYASLEEHWAWWSRHIYWNRFVDAPKPVYKELLDLVREKDYFVLTTNVDHQFQRSCFDKECLFYMQGDYGLFQCVDGCGDKTYDNETIVREMLARQKELRIPSELIPHCPLCGKPMTMNLRCDDRFVQDEGWYAAKDRYDDFLRRHRGQQILFLELGVGNNTPGIIKYPFLRMTQENSAATYACINYKEAYTPSQLQTQSICINGDIGDVLAQL